MKLAIPSSCRRRASRSRRTRSTSRKSWGPPCFSPDRLATARATGLPPGGPPGGAGKYRFNNTPLLWLHGLVDFARGAHLARLLVAEGGFCHLYAQFADDACTTTMVAAMLAKIPFSFRSHTSPNPQLIQEKVRPVQFVVSASLYDKRVLIHWCGERVAKKIYVNRLGVPLDRYHRNGVFRCSGVQVFRTRRDKRTNP